MEPYEIIKYFDEVLYEMRLHLSTQPEYRDESVIRKILWSLKDAVALKHLFPTEMEIDLARYVSYQCYDDNRVLAKQGQKVDRFYYVISGKLLLMREFPLTGCDIMKETGQLSKGMTSDVMEMEAGAVRQRTMVAKGNLECLELDAEVFSHFRRSLREPPLEFLRSLKIFRPFPLKLFLEQPGFLEQQYFGPGQVIVRDMASTNWIHIIKVGNARIVRRQILQGLPQYNRHGELISDPRKSRRAYLLLDVLASGDIFCLETGQMNAGLSVLSNGAEVVKVNRRYFFKHANNNTTLEAKAQGATSYMSEDEAYKSFYEQQAWLLYKDNIRQQSRIRY